MNAQKALIGLLASVICSFTACLAVSAQTAALRPPSPAISLPTRTPVIYVGDFTTQAPTADSESGLLRREKAEHDAKKINANAQSLTEAVVTALHNKGWVAYRINSSQPLPSSGWLVDGNYQQAISHKLLPSISSLMQPKQPNTDVSIRIVDLGAKHAGTLAAFSNAATLKGQGTSLASNPYMIAAAVIANRIEANSSINTLAGAIADRVVTIDKQMTATGTAPALTATP